MSRSLRVCVYSISPTTREKEKTNTSTWEWRKKNRNKIKTWQGRAVSDQYSALAMCTSQLIFHPLRLQSNGLCSHRTRSILLLLLLQLFPTDFFFNFVVLLVVAFILRHREILNRARSLYINRIERKSFLFFCDPIRSDPKWIAHRANNKLLISAPLSILNLLTRLKCKEQNQEEVEQGPLIGSREIRARPFICVVVIHSQPIFQKPKSIIYEYLYSISFLKKIKVKMKSNCLKCNAHLGFCTTAVRKVKDSFNVTCTWLFSRFLSFVEFLISVVARSNHESRIRLSSWRELLQHVRHRGKLNQALSSRWCKSTVRDWWCNSS